MGCVTRKGTSCPESSYQKKDGRVPRRVFFSLKDKNCEPLCAYFQGTNYSGFEPIIWHKSIIPSLLMIDGYPSILLLVWQRLRSLGTFSRNTAQILVCLYDVSKVNFIHRQTFTSVLYHNYFSIKPGLMCFLLPLLFCEFCT